MRGPVSAPAAIMTNLFSSRMFQSAALKAAPVFGLVPRVGSQLKMGEVSGTRPLRVPGVSPGRKGKSMIMGGTAATSAA